MFTLYIVHLLDKCNEISICNLKNGGSFPVFSGIRNTILEQPVQRTVL